MKRKTYVLFAVFIQFIMTVQFLSACNSETAAQSNLERVTAPSPSGGSMEALVRGNTTFAFNLFHQLVTTGENENFSPYSITLALAMIYAGARGETASQMANALSFSLSDEQIPTTFNLLDQELAGRPEEAAEVDEDDRFELTIANSLWGQEDWPFLPEFLDMLALHFGAKMRLVDFAGSQATARKLINNWVSNQTHKRIKDILPPGSPDTNTRLALVNAIYFKATWEYEFDPSLTGDEPFHLLNGETVMVDMMELDRGENFRYADGDGWQAVALPYRGGLAEMVIIMPDDGDYEAFESTLDSVRYEQILSSLAAHQVLLHLPKFTYETKHNLVRALSQMGMKDAFDPEAADFSGMDGTLQLFIGDAIHQAFLGVDEKGTEAVAATIVLMVMSSMPIDEITLTIDHPFFFVIRDVPTGTILFMGRVLDPR